jgi:membrane protein
MLVDAARPREGIIATFLGLGALLFAAIGVVIQLKDALNIVWEVEPSQSTGIKSYILSYLLSFTGVLAIGFLLMVSFLVTTGLVAAENYAAPYMQPWVLPVISILVSFSTITVLFAMMYKWLPDAPVDWQDVWLGAAVTAALFEIGKFAISFYIGRLGLESTYGAAASIVVVLIWAYYSSQIVLMGAEITHAFALHQGSIKCRRAGNGEQQYLGESTTGQSSERFEVTQRPAAGAVAELLNRREMCIEHGWNHRGDPMLCLSRPRRRNGKNQRRDRDGDRRDQDTVFIRKGGPAHEGRE